MRKLILFSVCLLAFTITGFSQDNPKLAYCEIVGKQKAFTTRINIVLDFGQQMKVFDNRLRDDAGNLREFNSMIDALNFMSKQGWEFVQAYSVAVPNENSEYHYVLKKKFEDLNEEEKAFLKEYR